MNERVSIAAKTTLAGTNNASMGEGRDSHTENVLSELVGRLVLGGDYEEHSSDKQSYEDELNLAKSIIDGHVSQCGAPSLAEDLSHVYDLIKQKLLDEADSTERAVRFSNLYSRLLASPVLKQTWAHLHFLNQVADTRLRNEATPRQADSHAPRAPLGIENSDWKIGTINKKSQSSAIKDTFAAAGLSRLPTGESRSKSRVENKTNGALKPQDEGKPVLGSTNERQQNMDTSNDTAPSEATLLHDLPFMLQGLSTTHLPFSDDSTLKLPPTLPLPLISLLHTLAEPALLYRRLLKYVESRDEGLVSQSLRAAIGNELRSYLGLIAALEGEIRRALTSAANDGNARGSVGKIGVTLKRCVIWTREATMGLRLMSLMVEEAAAKKGGQLISMIHRFSSSHGDPFVIAFAERMLVHVTRPFYDMLRQWIYDGELSDPYHEFFIIEQDAQDQSEKGQDARRVPATSVWEDKYKLDESMVPTIVAEELAKKVFLIGKSLNFIRYGCGDSAWVESYCKEASRELHYGDTATLETSIDKAYKTTMARLIHLMNSKFHLLEHLQALKKYLLLGQGDFIALLMESLASNLDNPAGSQYRHTLTAQLEHAIRGSNAQHDSQDVLRRLDARLVELSHGDVGWDVFTLEYKVDAPADVVITPWASKQYLVIFNLLWRVKRVEFALGSTWRRCMTGARGVLSTVDDKLSRDWKSARCCIAEMIHFVNQLQYYILFEVIEASWDQLQKAINKTDCTLDDLISAHTNYLRAITHKGLLGKPASGIREESFTVQLHEILKIMLSYKDVVDGLYSFSVAEFTRRQEIAAKIETRTARGQWGLTDKDDEDFRSPTPPSSRQINSNRSGTDSPFAPNPNAGIPGLNAASTGEDQMLPALRHRLGELAKDFKQRVNVLLGDLAVQSDVDMKFLGVVMNFNDVYMPKRRRREHVRRTPGPAIGTVAKDKEKGKEKEERREEK
ncbi:MAG: hypothetical protein Q9191_000870 [Dirinaria sp. TL-2023a]